MGPQALCMLGIWVLALNDDVSSACQHSLPHLALRPVYALHVGPQALCMLGKWALALIYDAACADVVTVRKLAAQHRHVEVATRKDTFPGSRRLASLRLFTPGGGQD